MTEAEQIQITIDKNNSLIARLENELESGDHEDYPEVKFAIIGALVMAQKSKVLFTSQIEELNK